MKKLPFEYIAPLLFVSVMLSFFFVTMIVTYNAKLLQEPELINQIRPEFKDGVIFYESDTIFSSRNIFDREGCLGIYYPFIQNIIVVTNETILKKQRITLKELLCHEICHFEWWTMMNRTEKKFWIESYQQSKEQGGEYFTEVYPSAGEFYSEWCENNWQRCYVNEWDD